MEPPEKKTRLSKKNEENQPIESSKTFENILQELKTIVDRLEQGELTLDESLNFFERGIQLSHQGQTLLDSAEKRIEILISDGQKSPFDPKE